MVNDYKSTHTITLELPDGDTQAFSVMLVDDKAYTREQHEQGQPATWQLDAKGHIVPIYALDPEWTFKVRAID